MVTCLASMAFLERFDRWSPATRETYEVGLRTFADCFQVSQPDLIVERVKAGELDLYEMLDKFLGIMSIRGLAPKTVWCYLTVIKGYFRYEGVAVDNYQLRVRTSLPLMIGRDS